MEKINNLEEQKSVLQAKKQSLERDRQSKKEIHYYSKVTFGPVLIREETHKILPELKPGKFAVITTSRCSGRGCLVKDVLYLYLGTGVAPGKKRRRSLWFIDEEGTVAFKAEDLSRAFNAEKAEIV